MISDDLDVRIKVGRLYDARMRTSDALIALPTGTRLTIDDVMTIYPSVVSGFSKVARESPVFREALHRSLENFMIGARATADLRQAITAMLAGNIDAMLEGHACVRPADLTSTEYVLAVVENVYPTVGSTGMDFSAVVEVLSGCVAGALMEFPIRGEALLARLLWVVGIAPRHRRDERTKVLHPRFLSGCHLFIKPTDTEGRVFIRDMGSNASLKARNKKLHVRRTTSRECPHDFEWECSVCPVGAQRCALSTHPRDAVEGVCVRCGGTELVDPDHRDSASFECQYASWYRE